MIDYDKLDEFLQKYPNPHVILDNDWFCVTSSREFWDDESITEGESISFYASPQQLLIYLINIKLKWSSEYV